MADEDEARFLIKEFVIPAQARLEKKIDLVCAEQTSMRIENETTKAKAAHVEYQVLQLRESVDKHRDDAFAHYNPYHSETIPQKLWRKKPEIAAGGFLGTTLAALLYLLVEKMLGG